jgi:hypothetical protein
MKLRFGLAAAHMDQGLKSEHRLPATPSIARGPCEVSDFRAVRMG